MELQNNITELRAKHKVTQAQLAETVGVSRKTINTIENRVFVPSTILALKISKALRTSVEGVFYLDSDG
ncbi:MAG: helix-turn-helix transcriptional regulator [Pikeienuella sp.]